MSINYKKKYLKYKKKYLEAKKIYGGIDKFEGGAFNFGQGDVKQDPKYWDRVWKFRVTRCPPNKSSEIEVKLWNYLYSEHYLPGNLEKEILIAKNIEIKKIING